MDDTTVVAMRNFIVENFLFGDVGRLPADHVSLIENDLIDSTGVLELVAFLEESFGITVADAEIVPSNLDTVANLCAYIARKKDGAAVAT